MGNTIIIGKSPSQLRKYLAKGDDHNGKTGYNGKVDNQKEVNKAVAAACQANSKACKDIKRYVKSMGWQVKVSKIAKKSGKEKLKSHPIKGYFYDFNGIEHRPKGDGKWRIFGKANYGGFGVNNGDSAGKEHLQINAKGLKYIAFNIKNPDKGSFKLPEFKVEINGARVGNWIKAQTKGQIKLEVDQELFPKGKLLKFQLVFKPGKVNFILENPRALGEK